MEFKWFTLFLFWGFASGITLYFRTFWSYLFYIPWGINAVYNVYVDIYSSNCREK